MRIPRAHDLTLAYCELFELPLRPFVMGNPKGSSTSAGARDRAEEATASPSGSVPARRTSEAGPPTSCGRRPSASCGPWSSRTATGAGTRSSASTTSTRSTSSSGEGLVARRDRVLHGAELPRGRHAQRGGRGPPRGPRRGVRRHAGDRGRHGPAAERVLCPARPRGPLRRRRLRHRAGRRRRHGPLQDRGRPVQRPRRLRDLHRPVPGAAHDRGSRPFSAGKQRAIRQLNYHASTKILFQVRTASGRTRTGSSGGTVTDLPIRRLNYPTPDPDPSRGVLLASYTWGQDALQWGAMDEETRLEEALEDVARIHPGSARSTRAGLARLVRRPLGARRLRHVRPGAADRSPGRHRPTRGAGPLRRRALLAVPRLDPGAPRVRIAGARSTRRPAPDHALPAGPRPRPSVPAEWLRYDPLGVGPHRLLVPQGMAYAELAGLPAVAGIYAR